MATVPHAFVISNLLRWKWFVRYVCDPLNWPRWLVPGPTALVAGHIIVQSSDILSFESVTLGKCPLDTLKFFNENLQGNQFSQRALKSAEKASSRESHLQVIDAPTDSRTVEVMEIVADAGGASDEDG